MPKLNCEVVRNSFVSMLVLALMLASDALAQEKQPSLRGFTAASSSKQIAVEEKFKAMISPEREKEFHRYFTKEPHPAGTPQNKEVADYIAKTWKEQGIEDVVMIIR